MIKASEDGDADLVQKLLREGASVNEKEPNFGKQY